MAFLFVVGLILISIFGFIHIIYVRVLNVIVIVFIEAILHNDVVPLLIVLKVLFLFSIVSRSFCASYIKR